MTTLEQLKSLTTDIEARTEGRHIFCCIEPLGPYIHSDLACPAELYMRKTPDAGGNTRLSFSGSIRWAEPDMDCGEMARIAREIQEAAQIMADLTAAELTVSGGHMREWGAWLHERMVERQQQMDGQQQQLDEHTPTMELT